MFTCIQCNGPLSGAERLKRFRSCPACRKRQPRGRTKPAESSYIHVSPNRQKQLERSGSGESWWAEAPRDGMTELAMHKLRLTDAPTKPA